MYTERGVFRHLMHFVDEAHSYEQTTSLHTARCTKMYSISYRYYLSYAVICSRNIVKVQSPLRTLTLERKKLKRHHLFFLEERTWCMIICCIIRPRIKTYTYACCTVYSREGHVFDHVLTSHRQGAKTSHTLDNE